MNKYQMKISLNEPVCIAQKRGTGNVIETLDYIPGSTIRGALAMRYLQQNGEYNAKKRRWKLNEPEKQKEFESLFASKDTHFGSCYPEGGKVIPFTATSCKYFSGFLNSDSEQHGVLDMLIPLAEYELIKKKQPGGKVEENFEYCYPVTGQTCKAVMERFGGYYEQVGDTSFDKSDLSKRLIARTAVMDSLETALSGNLYTLEVLNEGQNFVGWLETDEQSFQTMHDLLQNTTLRIGSSKSRGLGEIELKLRKVASSGDKWLVKDVLKRLSELNKKLEVKIPKRYFFSVTLHSDAILRDEILRFKSTLDIQDLLEALSCPTQQQQDLLNKFQLLRSWLSTHLVTGWNSAWKLPKDDEVAISKGSVFLFVTKPCETRDDAEIQLLASMLEKIELSGIGERRNEGFGKIRICDEFHWKVNYK